MIPAPFIHDLIARADIVEIVGRHMDLKKAGINYKGLCPFHGEKTPSFIVSPTRQTYHCFGCGVHGNAVGFLMEHTGVGFIDAVRDLAQQLGMTVPEDERSAEEVERDRQSKARQQTLVDVLAQAALHYRKQLKTSAKAVAYLKGRGLTGEVAARFGLGYAPEGWRALASAFPRYDEPLLVEAGLVILQGEDDEEAKRYDRFRDRVMFPIRSVQGEVIGFGGRVLDGGEPKYLNSPETPVFVKGRELYGLYEARKALREKGYALVVEGYMDVVALAQHGLPNAVATLGTACTAEHVQKLLRFTDRIVFSFDGDAAGRRAAGRALEAALPHATDTRSIRFLFLPTEHDPDSYVREHGTAGFERCIEEAVPLSRQLVEAAGEGCDLAHAEGRAKLLAQARPLWSALPDGALKAQLLAELAAAAQLGVEDVRALWRPRGEAPAGTSPPSGRPAGRNGRAREASPRGAGSSPRSAATLLDRALALLVHRSDLWSVLDGETHDLLAHQEGPHGALFAALERCVHEHGAQAPAAMLDEMRSGLAEPAAHAVLDRVAALLAPESAADLEAELRVTVERLRLQAVQDELKLLFESGAELSDAAQQRGRSLMAAQASLKARLAAAPAAR